MSLNLTAPSRSDEPHGKTQKAIRLRLAAHIEVHTRDECQVISIPAKGVVPSYFAGHAHTQNFFQGAVYFLVFSFLFRGVRLERFMPDALKLGQLALSEEAQ